MKYVIRVLMIVILASLPVVSQTKSERELIKLENDLSDALVRYDIKALDQIWSDDFVFTAPNGKTTTKAERLEGVKAAAKSKETIVGGSTNDEVKVNFFKDSAVVMILSTWRGIDGKQEFISQYQATHFWVKQNRRWQLVAAHVSQVKK